MLTHSGSRGGISVCSDRDKDGGRDLSIVPGRSEQSMVEFGLRLIPGALMSQFRAEEKVMIAWVGWEPWTGQSRIFHCTVLSPMYLVARSAP